MVLSILVITDAVHGQDKVASAIAALVYLGIAFLIEFLIFYAVYRDYEHVTKTS